MDILALCRKMVILFFCMATGFAAAKGGAMVTQCVGCPVVFAVKRGFGDEVLSRCRKG